MTLSFLQSHLLKQLRQSGATIDRLERVYNRASVRADIASMLEARLIDAIEIEGVTIFCCSTEGRLLADEIIERDQRNAIQPTPPRTIPIPKEIYKTQDRQYVRNAGNKHILSRGL